MSGEYRSFLSRHWVAIVAVALVTLLAAALFPRAVSPPPAEPAPDARPLTTSGDARDVALSPDGSRIAYLTRGGTALAVQPLPDGAPAELLRGDVPLGAPRWHPNGDLLLFGCPLPRALCRVPAAGGDGDTVALHPGVGITAYDFAPDGDYLLATAAGPWIYRGTRPASLTLVGSDSVVADGTLADLRGVAAWVVGVAAAPAGADVAYHAVAYDGTGVIARVVPGTAAQRTLLGGLPEGYNLGSATSGRVVWTAEGFIYYTHWAAGRRAIAHLRADALGRDPAEVLGDLPHNVGFDVSHDGTLLAYADGASRRRLYLFPRDGRAPRVALAPRDPTRSYGSPALSPGGDVVAYVGTGPTGESDIFLRPLDGRQERRVTFDRRPKRALAWSPDGDRLAFLSESGRGPWLMTVDTASGRVAPLGNAPAHPYGQPDWSADGRYVLYALLEGTRLALVEASEGGRMAPVGPPGTEALHAVLSPDGARVAAARVGPGGRGIWLFALEGGPPTRLTTGPDRPLRWTGNGDLYFARQDLPYRASEVGRQSVSGGGTAAVWRLPAPCDIAELSISRDAQSLACSIDEFTSDAWIRGAPAPAESAAQY
ncbi:MAG: PD40 domain-containing protein [Gemmatimonadota bacterium]|nr:MAG: PD40 domain-containing protein [Gemmatimonadota bacterium]